MADAACKTASLVHDSALVEQVLDLTQSFFQLPLSRLLFDHFTSWAKLAGSAVKCITLGCLVANYARDEEADLHAAKQVGQHHETTMGKGITDCSAAKKPGHMLVSVQQACHRPSKPSFVQECCCEVDKGWVRPLVQMKWVLSDR